MAGSLATNTSSVGRPTSPCTILSRCPRRIHTGGSRAVKSAPSSDWKPSERELGGGVKEVRGGVGSPAEETLAARKYRGTSGQRRINLSEALYQSAAQITKASLQLILTRNSHRRQSHQSSVAAALLSLGITEGNRLGLHEIRHGIQSSRSPSMAMRIRAALKPSFERSALCAFPSVPSARVVILGAQAVAPTVAWPSPRTSDSVQFQ